MFSVDYPQSCQIPSKKNRSLRKDYKLAIEQQVKPKSASRIALQADEQSTRESWRTTANRRGAEGVEARAGEAVGEDDLEPRVLLAHAGLGIGEVPPVPERYPGRRHGRAAGRPADPRRRRRLHGPVDPPPQRAHERAHRGRRRRPRRAPLRAAAQHRRPRQQLHCRRHKRYQTAAAAAQWTDGFGMDPTRPLLAGRWC